MPSASRTLGEILSDHKMFLPGSDLSKTIISILFVLFLLLLLANNSIFSSHISAIEPYREFSNLMLLFSLALAVWSAVCAHSALDSTPKEIVEYKRIYKGKLLLGFSVLLFFLVVCLWVLVLGGIMSSPFASLLSISPVLLSIQYFRDKTTNYDKILDALRPHWNNVSDEDLNRKNRVAKYVISSLGMLPLGVVIVTLVGGQIWISCFDGHLLLLGNAFQEVIASTWYRKVYYCIFYMSVVIAAFGVMPQSATEKWTGRLF